MDIYILDYNKLVPLKNRTGLLCVLNRTQEKWKVLSFILIRAFTKDSMKCLLKCVYIESIW